MPRWYRPQQQVAQLRGETTGCAGPDATTRASRCPPRRRRPRAARGSAGPARGLTAARGRLAVVIREAAEQPNAYAWNVRATGSAVVQAEPSGDPLTQLTSRLAAERQAARMPSGSAPTSMRATTASTTVVILPVPRAGEHEQQARRVRHHPLHGSSCRQPRTPRLPPDKPIPGRGSPTSATDRLWRQSPAGCGHGLDRVHARLTGSSPIPMHPRGCGFQHPHQLFFGAPQSRRTPTPSSCVLSSGNTVITTDRLLTRKNTFPFPTSPRHRRPKLLHTTDPSAQDVAVHHRTC